MHAMHSQIGAYLVAIEYDDSLGLFQGSVVNKRYPVRLTAPTADELERKFERLFNTYLGAEAA